LDVRRNSSYRRASSSISMPLTPADEGVRISSLAVVCANGWMGALSGPTSGVGDEVCWSVSLSRVGSDEGIRIFEDDLSRSLSGGLGEIVGEWANPLALLS